MLKVGITGGIGSGKSTVSRIFEVLGVPVYYADTAAKILMTEDEELKQQIISEFGEEAYHAGELNRPWLARHVFSSEANIQRLNKLVHPAVIAHGAQWMASVKHPYAIKEAALFFESGSSSEIDFMIGVFAPRYLRMERVAQRNGWSVAEIQARMDQQIDDNIKMKLCDTIIVNDESQLLIPQVLQLHQQLMAASD